MFFSDWRVLRRRWYAVVAGVVLTVGLCFATMALLPLRYQATAECVLLPPENSLEKGDNPYLALGGLSTVADILTRSMTDATTTANLKAEGVTDPFTVTIDPTTAAPVIVIQIESATSDTAVNSMRAIVAQLPQSLDQVQRSAGVPTNSLIRSNVITQDSEGTPQSKSQVRALLVVGVGGLVGTWLATATLDSLIMRRRKLPVVSAGSAPASALHESALVDDETLLDFEKIIRSQSSAAASPSIRHEAAGHAGKRDIAR